MRCGRVGRKLYSRAGGRGGIVPGRHRSRQRLAAEARREQRAAEKIAIARLGPAQGREQRETGDIGVALGGHELHAAVEKLLLGSEHIKDITRADAILGADAFKGELIGSDCGFGRLDHGRSEEHTSELQSLMRISYAVFCLKKKTTKNKHTNQRYTN